jgi:hypothetical protein
MASTVFDGFQEEGKMRRRVLSGLAAAVILCLGTVTMHAGTVSILYDSGELAGSPTGAVLVTPDTRGACPTGVTSDRIYTTGVGTRQLKGVVLVQYVTDNGLVPVPNGTYAIDQTGDLDLTVFYPPASDWPVMSAGVAEIHVDIQIEMFQGGIKIATLGPGSDWDIFCLGPPPPPPGGQGCTPGFWKQSQHFDSYPAPYTPSSNFGAVFGVTPSTGASTTFLTALGLNGGGEAALMRHATAALLDAASTAVNYAYTPAAVIQLVQEAYATQTFEPIKNLFEAQNEKGCPLR